MTDTPGKVEMTNEHDSALGLTAIGLAHEFWRGHWETVEAAHLNTPASRRRAPRRIKRRREVSSQRQNHANHPVGLKNATPRTSDGSPIS